MQQTQVEPRPNLRLPPHLIPIVSYPYIFLPCQPNQIKTEDYTKTDRHTENAYPLPCNLRTVDPIDETEKQQSHSINQRKKYCVKRNKGNFYLTVVFLIYSAT